MRSSRTRFWSAVYTMLGSTMGVGLFSLPYVIRAAGPWLGLLWLIGIALLNLFVLQLYAEVVAHTSGHSRLPGLVGRYLGEHIKPFAGMVIYLSVWGTILTYIVLGGTFLHGVLGGFFGGPVAAYQIVYAGVLWIIILGGLGFIAWVERYMILILMAVFAVLVAAGLPHADWSELIANGTPGAWFLPFGPLLFSFASFSAIPEAAEILKQEKHRLRDAIFIVTGVVLLFYAAFSLITIAVAGPHTSPEAIEGIAYVLGEWFLILGSGMALLTSSNSFIVLGVAMTDSLVYDFKLKFLPAWLLSVGVPFAVFLLGARDFLKIVGITGGVLGALVGLLVLGIYSKARFDIHMPKRALTVPRFLIYIAGFVYMLGAACELFLS